MSFIVRPLQMHLRARGRTTECTRTQFFPASFSNLYYSADDLCAGLESPYEHIMGSCDLNLT